MELTRENALRLWGMLPARSWESVYNLLYNDYYEGHETGFNRDLVYRLMQLAQTFQNNNAEFPPTSEDFYETLNDRLVA